MKDKIFYVYQLVTSNDELIYIGKGSGNRMYKHSIIAMGSSINRTKNPKLYNKIKKVIDNGGFVKPEIIFKSTLESDCLNEEIKLIGDIGLENLCNLTIGGEGTSGYNLSEETKMKMSKAKKGKKSGPITEKRRLAIINGIKNKKNF